MFNTSDLYSHTSAAVMSSVVMGEQQTTTDPSQNIAIVSAVMSWIYISLGIVGMITNCCVGVVILQSRQLRRQLPNIFILNQCLADFWCSACVMASVFKNSRAWLDSIGGEIICRIYLTNLLVWIGFNASLYNLVALSVERYFEIVHPIRHRTAFDKVKALASIVLVWVLGAVWQSAAYIPHAAVIDGICYTQIFWDNTLRKIYGLANFAQKIAIPVVIFIWCYSAMARSLRLIGVTSAPAPGAGGLGMTSLTTSTGNRTSSVLSSRARARRNIFKMLLYVIVAHVISWSTNQTMFLAYTFGYPLNFTSVPYQVSIVLIYSSMCVNPFVYVLKYERFRKTFFRLIASKCHRMHIVTG